MKIAITGAGGLVGSALTRHLSLSHQIFSLKHSDLDITQPDAITEFFERERPNLLINCAVLNVDECETDPEKAIAINVTGPQALAAAANKVGAAIVHFSTNYVFDGEGEKIYSSDDAAHPINNYGQSKLDGENAVMNSCPHHFIIRTSWVYGVGKQNFLSLVHRDLKAGKRNKVVSDCWASSTYVEDLVSRTTEILDLQNYGIFHIVNEGVCSYLDFTYEAGNLIGLTETQISDLIELISEAEIKRPAKRPRFTPMRCSLSEKLGLKPLRHWKEALADYIDSN